MERATQVRMRGLPDSSIAGMKRAARQAIRGGRMTLRNARVLVHFARRDNRLTEIAKTAVLAACPRRLRAMRKLAELTKGW